MRHSEGEFSNENQGVIFMFDDGLVENDDGLSIPLGSGRFSDAVDRRQ